VARARAQRPGPSDARRAAGESRLWGEVRDAEGRVATSRLVAPEAYTLTARTAVAAARRVLAGGVATGFQTPSRALGADFILEQKGTRRDDLA
jgi:saccharopine dehydrogenase (NAD+, L-lysine-forming)